MGDCSCPECGTGLTGEEKFCPGCGHDLSSTCPDCGYSLSGEEAFCPECGNNLGQPEQQHCPDCGADLAPDAKFCHECGSDLTASASSAAATSCEFKFDPEEWSPDDKGIEQARESTLDDVWQCPRDPIEGERYCRFHQPEPLDDATAREAVLEQIDAASEDSERSTVELIGARFSTLDFADQTVGSETDVTLDLRHAKFEEDFHIPDARLEIELVADGAEIDGSINALDARLEEGGSFIGIHVRGRFAFQDSIIDWLDCTTSIFEMNTNFDGARIRGNATFDRVQFDGSALFTDVTFGGPASFRTTFFEGELVKFDKSVFRQGVDFSDATFAPEGVADSDAKFKHINVSGNIYLEKAMFADCGADFRGATIDGTVSGSTTADTLYDDQYVSVDGDVVGLDL